MRRSAGLPSSTSRLPSDERERMMAREARDSIKSDRRPPEGERLEERVLTSSPLQTAMRLPRPARGRRHTTLGHHGNTTHNDPKSGGQAIGSWFMVHGHVAGNQREANGLDGGWWTAHARRYAPESCAWCGAVASNGSNKRCTSAAPRRVLTMASLTLPTKPTATRATLLREALTRDDGGGTGRADRLSHLWRCLGVIMLPWW